MKDNNCIFCKIANGEIPSATIFEDENFRVILDRGPASKGHALILPKEHYADIFELKEEMAENVLKVAKKVGKKMMRELNCDGLNLVQNNGEAAGQTVFHFHMHLIPRYKEEASLLTWNPGELTEEEMKALTEKLFME